MALNYKLLYFKIKKPEIYSNLNLIPISSEFMAEYISSLDPSQVTNIKFVKASLADLKKKMLQQIRLLMLAFLSPVNIRVELFILFQKFINFFSFGFAIEEVLEYLTLYLHSFDSRTKYMLFDFISKILEKFTVENYLYVYERIKNQDDNSLLYVIDDYYNKDVINEFLAGHTKIGSESMSDVNRKNFYSYILSYNTRKYKYECIEAIAKFLRKSISVVIFDVENLDHFDRNFKLISNLPIQELKNMPLNTFIAINKLFITLLEIKTILENKENKRHALMGEPVETFSSAFINLCIHYFSQKRHLAFKHQTMYSIRDINIHKKLIDNLITIYRKLKKMLYEYKNFPDKIFLFNCENNTYYDGKCWNAVRSTKNFSHKNKYVYANYPEFLAESSDSKAVMKAILWFIKQETDMLRSLLYNEFRNIKIDMFSDSITIQSKDILIVKELFKINPGAACMFIQRLVH